jgi:hypothetical protein
MALGELDAILRFVHAYLSIEAPDRSKYSGLGHGTKAGISQFSSTMT